MTQVSIDKKKLEGQTFVRNIIFDIILTLITCWIYNVYVNVQQIKAVNHMLGSQKYSPLKWFIFTILTCGIYHIYHEYILSRDICNCIGRPDSSEPLAHLVLSLFGLSLVADALQQNIINSYYGQNTL